LDETGNVDSGDEVDSLSYATMLPLTKEKLRESFDIRNVR
jgi:hypothetical protein